MEEVSSDQHMICVMAHSGAPCVSWHGFSTSTCTGARLVDQDVSTESFRPGCINLKGLERWQHATSQFMTTKWFNSKTESVLSKCTPLTSQDTPLIIHEDQKVLPGLLINNRSFEPSTPAAEEAFVGTKDTCRFSGKLLRWITDQISLRTCTR